MTNRHIDENGYIKIENNPITREGVFEYLGRSIGAEPPDKIFKVYRPREEIEDQECIDSFKLLPIIDDHEMLGDGYTDPSDYGTHGTTGESIETRDGVMYATLRMFSEKIANALKKGKKDLSLGYRCVYEKAAGSFRGESYDYIQRQLRGNHLALVDEARCAVSVLDHHITYDSIDIPSQKENGMDKEKKGMDELTLESLAQAIQALSEKIDAMANMGADADVEKEAADAESDKDAEKATDADEEADKGKAEDEELKDDNTEGGNNADASMASGLDSRLKAIEKKTSTMDQASFVKAALKEMAAKNELAEQLSHHIGTFDHSEKTLSEVASYGVKKLGLDAAKGQEMPMLRGYLQAAKVTRAPVMDSRSGKSSIVDNYINGK